MAVIVETEFDDFPTGTPGDSFVGALNTTISDNVDTMLITLRETTTYTFSIDNPEINIRLLTTNYGNVLRPPDGTTQFEYTTPEFFSGDEATYMIYVIERLFTDELLPYTVTTAVGSMNQPDLVMETTGFSDYFWSDGEDITLKWLVGNDGLDDAPSTRTAFYISDDETIDVNDTLLFIDDATGALSPGDLIREEQALNVDFAALGLTPGAYWVGALSDFDNSVAETVETNNAATPSRIEIVGPATLGTINDFVDMMVTRYWVASEETPHKFVTPGNVISVDITALTDEGQQLARWAMEAWSAVADVTFKEVASGLTQISFDDNRKGANATSTYDPDGVFTSAHINISSNWLNRYGATADSYSLQTYIHELGHALGLGHAGLYNNSAVYGVDASFTNDSNQMSIMSYISPSDNPLIDADDANLAGPMIADIVAMQSLYGAAPARAATLSLGDTTWGANSTLSGYQGKVWRSVFNGENSAITDDNLVAFTIFDRDGTDVMDFSTADVDTFQLIDMNAGGISYVGGFFGTVVIALDTVIENAIGGAGEDVIDGNSADNVIQGGGQKDEIYGNGGNDRIVGGRGADTLNGGAGADLVDGGAGDDLLNGDGGRDTLNGGKNNDMIKGGKNDDSLNGDAGRDKLLGQAGNDILLGGAGADRLLGGGGRDRLKGEAGNDRLEGGAANDLLFGGNNADILVGGGGRDKLRGEAGADQLFGSTGRDSLFGGFGNDILEGGAGNDFLFGQGGDDRLDGGTGDNQLTGNAGADIFQFSGGRDVVTDFSAAEGDRIDLIPFPDIEDFADLVANHLRDVSGNAEITDSDGNTLVLHGIRAEDLNDSDFIF